MNENISTKYYVFNQSIHTKCKQLNLWTKYSGASESDIPELKQLRSILNAEVFFISEIDESLITAIMNKLIRIQGINESSIENIQSLCSDIISELGSFDEYMQDEFIYEFE